MNRIFSLFFLIFSFLIIFNTSLMSQGSEWLDKQYSVKGDWEITEKDNKQFLVLGDNFYTGNGPDLKIYITPTDPTTINNRDNVVDFKGIFLDDMIHKGGQTFEIPAGTDVDAMKSIVIHCTQYSVVWGAAPIK